VQRRIGKCGSVYTPPRGAIADFHFVGVRNDNPGWVLLRLEIACALA
jgi:hypothetical protein